MKFLVLMASNAQCIELCYVCNWCFFVWLFSLYGAHAMPSLSNFQYTFHVEPIHITSFLCRVWKNIWLLCFLQNKVDQCLLFGLLSVPPTTCDPTCSSHIFFQSNQNFGNVDVKLHVFTFWWKTSTYYIKMSLHSRFQEM